MSATAFDTLRFVKTLLAHGFATQQAEGLAEAVGDVQSSNEAATKHDLDVMRLEMQGTHNDLKNDINEVKRDVEELRTELKHDMSELRSELKHDMSELRTELKHDMSELRTELKHDMSEIRTELKHDMSEMKTEMTYEMKALESRLLIRLAGMGVVSLGAIAAFMRFYIGHL